MKLDGKVAIVTGSGRGLGRAIALALARAGARVVVIEVMAARPGQTDTPMWRSMYSREEQALRKQAGQVQTPEDFTNLVLFLASEAGNGWSGQVIVKGVYIPT